MGKAAPYAPDTLSQSGGAADSPDAKLLDLCAQFHRLTEADAAAWERYCSMPEDSPEAKALSLEFDGRYDAWAAVSDTCYATPPRTPAGAAALLDVILSRDAEFIDAAAQKPLRLVRDSLQAMAMS
ncbi:hypothetical protein B6S44_24990 [Bosea sp. Tri-44]|nr:hypothetical protein B6S44_24990 [Bosea sp. Tri-44]